MPGSRFDPMKELTNIREQVNKALGDAFSGIGATIALDIYETDEAVVVITAPLYGLRQESLDIEIANGQLTITGETVAPSTLEDKHYVRRERKFGAFSRTVNLPSQVVAEQAKAQLKDHLLTISIPKVQETSPKVIKVKPIE